MNSPVEEEVLHSGATGGRSGADGRTPVAHGGGGGAGGPSLVAHGGAGAALGQESSRVKNRRDN